MGAFPGECQVQAFTVELGTPFDELLNRGGAFFYEYADRFRITQPIAGRNRVLLVEFDIVLVAQCNGDATLSVL